MRILGIIKQLYDSSPVLIIAHIQLPPRKQSHKQIKTKRCNVIATRIKTLNDSFAVLSTHTHAKRAGTKIFDRIKQWKIIRECRKCVSKSPTLTVQNENWRNQKSENQSFYAICRWPNATAILCVFIENVPSIQQTCIWPMFHFMCPTNGKIANVLLPHTLKFIVRGKPEIWHLK